MKKKRPTQHFFNPLFFIEMYIGVVVSEHLHDTEVCGVWMIYMCWEGEKMVIYTENVTDQDNPGEWEKVSYGPWDCISDDEYGDKVVRYHDSKRDPHLCNIISDYYYWQDEIEAIKWIKRKVWKTRAKHLVFVSKDVRGYLFDIMATFVDK